MVAGIRARDNSLEQVLRSLYDRIRRLERPVTLRLGGVGGVIGGKGWNIGLDPANGNLIAISDDGTTTTLATY